MAAAILIISWDKSIGQANKPGNWLIYFGNQKINQQWNFHNEFQYRQKSWMGDLSQILLRVGVGYNLTHNNNNILVGYGFIKSFEPKDSLGNRKQTNEDRIFQQFITKHNWGTVSLTHRLRIEQRFIENDFSMRGRYFLLANLPLNKKTLSKGAIYIASSDEIFFNITSGRFDRNRIYSGLGYVFETNIRVETGFMIQNTVSRQTKQFQIILINNLPF